MAYLILIIFMSTKYWTMKLKLQTWVGNIIMLKKMCLLGYVKGYISDFFRIKQWTGNDDCQLK